MIKLSQFEAFNAVMLSGSMTAAAGILFTSQPNVSRSISKLEKESGLKLFERTPGKLVPTPDGLALFEEVQRSFVGLQKLTAEANRIRRSGSGVLRLGAVQSHSTAMIPQAVARFSDKFPNATLSIHTAHSSVLAQWVREHICDVAIVSHRHTNDGVEGEVLYASDAVCIMPATHHLAQKSTVGPSDLIGERFVTFPKGEPLRVAMDRVLYEAGVELHDAIETSYSSITCSLVSEGIGIALVNPFIATNYLSENVVARPFAPSIKHEAIAIFPSGKPPSRFVIEFMDALKTVVSEQKKAASKRP